MSVEVAEYIARQNWGLLRFAPHQTTLEQIFINLTMVDAEQSHTDEVTDKDRAA